MRGRKRTHDLSLEEVQRGNRAWWSENPMTYDWRGEIPLERLSPAWFEAIDARFIASARLFTDDRPFDRVLPLDRLAGRDALEIGCGMGLHAETLARAGARLTAIDLSPVSIEVTRRRFELKGLSADLRVADAEALPFADRSFDFVWSWGVIHHSARTALIVREIARVLRPSGECRIMVYSREGSYAWVSFFRDHLLGGQLLRRSFDETLSRSTDGFFARFYARDQLEDLFRAFFRRVSCEVLGQESDVLPLPAKLRRLAAKVAPEAWMRRAQARWGSFLVVTASEPF